jgi:hypothetical protein
VPKENYPIMPRIPREEGSSTISLTPPSSPLSAAGQTIPATSGWIS